MAGHFRFVQYSVESDHWQQYSSRSKDSVTGESVNSCLCDFDLESLYPIERNQQRARYDQKVHFIWNTLDWSNAIRRDYLVDVNQWDRILLAR